MDRRAAAVGAALTAGSILVVWFGQFPWGFFVLAGIGPLVAGFLSRSREVKAAEGVAAIGLGFLLAIAGLVLGRVVIYQRLPLRWLVDVAFSTALMAGIFTLFLVPVCATVGAVLGVAGAFARGVVFGFRPS